MSNQSQRQPSSGSTAQDHEQLQTDPPEDVHYTAYIRLPFPRHDFVDPPLVTWPARKDTELWRILSQSPPGRHGASSELEWKRLAAQFDVSLAFILQQAAWLYERQLSQVRAQMRRVGRPLSGNYSAGAGTAGSPGGSPRLAGGASGALRPASSSVASRGFEVGGQEGGAGLAGGAQRPSTISRIPSSATVTQSRQILGFRAGSAQDSRGAIARGSQGSGQQQQQQQQQQRDGGGGLAETKRTSLQSQGPGQDEEVDNLANSSSESEDDAADGHQGMPARSKLFRRPVQPRRGGLNKATRLSEEEDDGTDEDDGPTFIPLPATGLDGAEQQDMGATVRTAAGETSKASSDEAEETTAAIAEDVKAKGKRTDVTRTSSNMSEASSVSSAGPLAPADSHGRRAAALSPRQQAEIKGRAGSRKDGSKREGSEGTPSMGSSFSDLEDTSVTQSAMEEYYLSKMQHGAASRMSTFSQALKSRYLPQQQQQQQR